MKRNLLWINFLLIAALLLATGSATAETYSGADNMSVTLNARGKIVSTFKSSDIDRALVALEPGDSITFRVALRNEYKTSVIWYMLNRVLKSLEDSSVASGGAYTYTLTYTDPEGAVHVLYDSDTVGGEAITAAGEGLHEATSSLSEYFRLGRMNRGQQGLVTLTVALDGESQGNRYQDTTADLMMKFACEIDSETKKPGVVGTGDETELLPLYLVMVTTGALLLILAIRRSRKGRKS